MTAKLIAAKFGGTSVGSAESIKQVCNIIKGDPQRRAIVVSAPAGITNKLVAWVRPQGEAELPAEIAYFQKIFKNKQELFDDIFISFEEIVAGLGVDIELKKQFALYAATCKQLQSEGKEEELYHFGVHFGEYINAQIVAAASGYEFADATTFIRFDESGRFSMELTRDAAEEAGLMDWISNAGIVIPGFYGLAHDGTTLTFSRGGSDITGAIVAALIDAEVYENWTDVEGVCAADPKIVPHARKNAHMSYKELRELAFMGAKVFHEDAVAIVRGAGIPIHLRSTMAPEKVGTWIVPSLPEGIVRPTVTGVAGKNGFSIITMEKFGMNDMLGILSDAAHVFTEHKLSVDVASSIDAMSFIVETETLNPVRESVISSLKIAFKPDDIRITDGIALVCTVGEGMRNKPGVSATVDTALWKAGINIILELQGGSQINIIRGVKDVDAASAVRAIHDASFPE